MTTEEKVTAECKHDYNNPKRLGRARYVCKDCGKDITLELVLIEEIKSKTPSP